MSGQGLSFGFRTITLLGVMTPNHRSSMRSNGSPTDYLADQLERLLALPLTTPEDVEHWYEECSAVQQTLEQQFPHFEPEHEVWHFFSDADIRSKDSDYCDRQHRLMCEYVRRLRNESENA